MVHACIEGHPHVCGEEDPNLISTTLNVGTPPRVWGRVSRLWHKNMDIRDTPTCVGKRVMVWFCIASQKGHPHVCGEEGL